MKPLSDEQLKALGEFCRDIAKIIFGSAVIGFFVKDSSVSVSGIAFVVGLVLTLFFASVGIAAIPRNKEIQNQV